MSRPTPETDAMQRIQFEGCTCIVAAPEDIEALERQRDELAEALQATLGHSHEDWPCQICENSRKVLASVKEGGV